MLRYLVGGCLGLLAAQVIADSGPLKTAQGMTFAQVKAERMNDPKRDDICCTGHAALGEKPRFVAAKSGHYVKVSIDYRYLADVTFVFSCAERGFGKTTRRCAEQELEKKVVGATSDAAPYNALYGKYQSSWDVFDEHDRLKRTAKFGGHGPYYFKRAPLHDFVLLGPFDTKPLAVELTMATAEVGARAEVFKLPVQW